MILIYKRLTDEEYRDMGKQAIEAAKKFFAANPKRKKATAGVWHGKVISIRRNHVEEDVNAEVEKIIKGEAT